MCKVFSFHLSTETTTKRKRTTTKKNSPEMRLNILLIKKGLTLWFIFGTLFLPKQSVTPLNLKSMCCYYYVFGLCFSPSWHNSVDIINSSIICPEKGISFLCHHCFFTCAFMLNKFKIPIKIYLRSFCFNKTALFHMINWIMIEPQLNQMVL